MSVIDVARSQLGARYVWGGHSPAAGGFDCSGFVSWCYAQVGVSLPAFTDAVAGQTETIPAGSERSGDLVLYRYTDPAQPGVTYPHMGLVEAAGQSIDCAYPAGVTEHAMFSYPREFRRVSVGPDAAASPAAPAGGLAALVPPSLAGLAASPWARIAAIAGVAYLALGAINPSSSPWGGRRNPERHWLTLTTRHRRGRDTQEPAYYQREGDHWRLYYGKTGRTRSVAPTSDRAVSWQVDLAKGEGRYLRHERDNPNPGRGLSARGERLLLDIERGALPPPELYDGLASNRGGRIRVRKHGGRYSVTHEFASKSLPASREATDVDESAARNAAQRLYGRGLHDDYDTLFRTIRRKINPSTCPVCGGPTVASNPRKSKSKSCDPSKRFCAFWMGPRGHRRLVPFRASVGYSTEIEDVQKDIARERRLAEKYGGLSRETENESMGGVQRPPWAVGISNAAIEGFAREHGENARSPGWWERAGLYEHRARRKGERRRDELEDVLSDLRSRSRRAGGQERAIAHGRELVKAARAPRRGYRPPEDLPF